MTGMLAGLTMTLTGVAAGVCGLVRDPGAEPVYFAAVAGCGLLAGMWVAGIARHLLGGGAP